jgi:exodeoxyribonuclease-5
MGARLILCATQRLARSLRLAAADAAPAGAAGELPRAMTVRQWLDETIEAAVLCGGIETGDMPRRVLTDLEERLLWKQVIGRAVRSREDAPLFSLDGLAAAAQEAHSLVEAWRIDPSAAGTEEQRQFGDWRRRFLRHCVERGWYDASRHFAWQIARIESGAGALPTLVERAGFDRLNPLEARLFAALTARGVEVIDRQAPRRCEHAGGPWAYPDAATQFRAMARWVSDRLATSDDTRVGLVVPDLERHRHALCRALDAELDPRALTPGEAQTQRTYNVSLGSPLARVPLAATALALLRLGLSGRPIDQAEVGRLILGLWWSSDQGEADARARFEARCRRKLPATTRLAAMARLARRTHEAGLPISTLCTHLEHLAGAPARFAGKRPHATWAEAFRDLLVAVGWPGERTLSSHDFQAREAFLARLEELASLDAAFGDTTATDALATLQDACMRHLFQPQTEGRPRVEVLGVLEAAGETFDALWVAGMTDDVWPPPARPNPLLPVALQRRCGSPNASPEVQLVFAAAIHRRFAQAACDVVFSYPAADGERALRPSPLLAFPVHGLRPGEPAPLTERLRAEATNQLERLHDDRAPPVADATRLTGGTWLLRAQAICPAWAFYQYRLGAEPVEVPADGLDARERGTLLHGVLEAFWTGRDSQTVRDWSPEARRDEVETAVVAALAAYDAANPAAPLSSRLRALEAARLAALVAAWVELELERPVDFEVVACEEKHELSIEGIAARVTVDRIDALADGRRIVLDYKTGATVDARSWAADRIVEPQLPIYATWTVAPAPLAAIAFAQIRSDRLRFVGIAESPHLLPKVDALADARKLFDAERFPDWAALLEHWRLAISAIAAEIKSGDARVIFTDETLLEHCPVRPILRLAERRRLLDLRGGADA